MSLAVCQVEMLYQSSNLAQWTSAKHAAVPAPRQRYETEEEAAELDEMIAETRYCVQHGLVRARSTPVCPLLPCG